MEANDKQPENTQNKEPETDAENAAEVEIKKLNDTISELTVSNTVLVFAML